MQFRGQIFPLGQIPTVSHQQYISLSISESPQTSVVRCTLFKPSLPEYIDTILILNLRITSYSGLETGIKNLLYEIGSVIVASLFPLTRLFPPW